MESAQMKKHIGSCLDNWNHIPDPSKFTGGTISHFGLVLLTCVNEVSKPIHEVMSGYWGTKESFEGPFFQKCSFNTKVN